MRIDFNKWCVYAHYVSKEKRPIYVGQGRSYRPYVPFERPGNWREFVDKNNGIVDVKILALLDTRKEALEFEKEQIKKLKPICNRFHNGWHLKHSADSKSKIRSALKGYKHSVETKLKMSIASSKRKHTAATKKKIGIISRGRKHTPEAREKMKGRVVSVETKRKISAANKGKIISLKTRERIRRSHLQRLSS